MLTQLARELRSQRDVASKEVKKLQSQLANAKVASVGLTEELAWTDAKLSEQTLIDAGDKLRMEGTQFIGSDVEGLVRRGLRMGRTNADFEAAARKVSNFRVGAQADFNKALVAFPTTLFPFLGKVVVAARGALSEVTQILSDKLARSAT
ncbi:hypothetical protein Tco_0608318 [Tanacetum coccineum]